MAYRHGRNPKGMTAEQFNARYGVGTPAIYRTTHDAQPLSTKTRSKAWELGHGESVVMIEGKSGGVALWALQMPDQP